MAELAEYAALGARAAANQARYAAAFRVGRGPWKLHLGCGSRRLDGFVNVDHRPTRATDYVANIAKLPCKPGTVERIEAYHVIEHLPRPAAPGILAHWHALLAPGGVIALECPDFAQDIADWLAGDEDRLLCVFGRQRFKGDAHHWGYTAESLCALLEEVGFADARALAPTDYHAAEEPCIRVEATAH